MPFEINKEEQSLKLEKHFKYFFFDNVLAASKTTPWMRITGLGVGAISALATVAGRIAVLGEDLVKGLAHIAGSIIGLEKCSFSVGLTHICLNLPLHFISGIFYILIEPFLIIGSIFGMLFTPEKYCLSKLKMLDPDREEVKEINANLMKDPDNLEQSFKLAAYYKEGKGTEQNEKLAFEIYTKLANKDSDSIFVTFSMAMLGEMCIKNKDVTASLIWFNKAANRHDIKSMSWLANFYAENEEHKDLLLAAKWRLKKVDESKKEFERLQKLVT